MTVLIVDQFVGPTPYQLQKAPMEFAQLCAEMLAEELHPTFFRARIQEIEPATFRAPHCTTVWRADDDGMATMLTCNWDTSG